jgi:hypothetical protein
MLKELVGAGGPPDVPLYPPVVSARAVFLPPARLPQEPHGFPRHPAA